MHACIESRQDNKASHGTCFTSASSRNLLPTPSIYYFSCHFHCNLLTQAKISLVSSIKSYVLKLCTWTARMGFIDCYREQGHTIARCSPTTMIAARSATTTRPCRLLRQPPARPRRPLRLGHADYFDCCLLSHADYFDYCLLGRGDYFN
jgi:hypothetical protein